MITRADVENTLRAANPVVTNEEISMLHHQMEREQDNLQDEIAHRIRQQWTEHHGHQPDGLSWGQIMDRARQEAEEQIRAEYLDELTQQIVQTETEKDEDSAHIQTLASRDGWKTAPHRINPTHETTRLVQDLWPEEPAAFWVHAEALIETMRFHSEDVPTTPLHPSFDRITKMVREASS